MAKIKFHKDKVKLPKTNKIKSIVGQEYYDDYQKRMQQAAKMAQENGKTRIKANEILIGENISKSD